MQPPPAHQILEFGEFEFDTLRRVLVSRVTGQPVDVGGRVVEALVYLLERPGQLIEKKALMDALWPHVVVEDGSLTQTIHTLRRALGEKAGDHRYIATVPGRGYRFIAEVRVREPGITVTEPPPRRPARALAWAAVGFAILVIGALAFLLSRGGSQPDTAAAKPPAAGPAAAAQPSIAVLPFVDMSASEDQAHFADGLSEEILNQLTRADALRVIARTSSFSFKDQNADIRTIAQRLEVTHVLEGSVRKSGDRVRITAQLIDGATSGHLWSDTYDRDVQDVFGVQREIAVAVADALDVTIRGAAPTRAETRSTMAYEHYLQGRHLFHRRSGTDLRQAQAHFDEAVRIDPEYGRAWAALAGVYMVARFEGVDFPDANENWRKAAERAVAVSPDLGEAHLRAAQFHWHNGDEATGFAYRARALELDPQDPLLLGVPVSDAIKAGDLDKAIELQKKVVAVDPLSATTRGNLGVMLATAGRYVEAQRELERSLELSPAAVPSMSNIAEILVLQGRPEEALAVLSRMPDSALRDSRFAMAHFALGELRDAEARLARLIEAATRQTSDFGLAITVAEVFAARKDVNAAFEWLDAARRRALAQPGGKMAHWVVYERLHLAPHLRPLRADPRWGRLRPESDDAPPDTGPP